MGQKMPKNIHRKMADRSKKLDDLFVRKEQNNLNSGEKVNGKNDIV